MSNFDKPVYGKDSPYEKIAVNPIEKEKKTREESYTGLKNSTRPQTSAALVSYFKKIAGALGFGKKSASSTEEHTTITDEILAFRKLLYILALEDLSHDPDFTQQLSDTWHHLLEDASLYPELSVKLNFFLQQVRNYPPGADYTLGYYFTEYAGKEWIPFPFMELLQALHLQAQRDPLHCTLANWLSLLDDIIEPES